MLEEDIKKASPLRKKLWIFIRYKHENGRIIGHTAHEWMTKLKTCAEEDLPALEVYLEEEWENYNKW